MQGNSIRTVLEDSEFFVLRGPVQSQCFLVSSGLQPEISDAAVLGTCRGSGQGSRQAQGMWVRMAGCWWWRRWRRKAEETAGCRVMEDCRVEGRTCRGGHIATGTLHRGVQPQGWQVRRHSAGFQGCRWAARRQYHSTCYTCKFQQFNSCVLSSNWILQFEVIW